MSNVTKEYTLNKFDIGANNNKVWKGKAYSDGTFEAQWGRVVEGANLAAQKKKFASEWEAVDHLDKKRNEKISKGYRDTKIFDGEISVNQSQPKNLAEVAAKQIVGADDAVTAELVKYLAEVNIHNITSATSIKYDAANATFSTPLGVLSPDAILEARMVLDTIRAYNAKNDFQAFGRAEKIRDYFQLVPKDFGRKIPSATELLTTDKIINKENEILDALESAISNIKPLADGDGERLFKCKLSKVPHWTEEGKKAFRHARHLFESTKNAVHGLTAGLKLVRLYEVEIEDMKKNFEMISGILGNIRSDQWHGTKASNLLSILKNGLIIPPASAAHCTGRMFGNGIYTSTQSTKALNYATTMWNRTGDSSRRFMFLCDVVLGKTFKPQTRTGVTYPAPGFDSTWVEAGTAGVFNHECIVYDTNQINLRYLCEFDNA